MSIKTLAYIHSTVILAPNTDQTLLYFSNGM